MTTDTPQNLSRHPVRVELVRKPLGIFKSLSAARENVLSIIPEVATRQTVVSGKTGKRWHMVMDPGAIREILLDRVEDYPKSVVTKNLLKPAIGEVAVYCRRRALALATTRRGAGFFPSQRDEPCADHDRRRRTGGSTHRHSGKTRDQHAGRDDHHHVRRDLGCDLFGR